MAMLQLTPRKEYYRWKSVNFCCVCGDDKSPSRFTKVFSAVGRQKKLSELICSLTHFELEESDSNAGSLKVCRSCEGKLTKSAAFQTCAITTLQSIREKASSKRCLTFSPSKSASQTEKRINVETLSDNQTEEEQVAMDSIPNVEVGEKYACDLTIVLSHLLSTAVCPILHNNQSILCVSLVA